MLPSHSCTLAVKVNMIYSGKRPGLYCVNSTWHSEVVTQNNVPGCIKNIKIKKLKKKTTRRPAVYTNHLLVFILLTVKLRFFFQRVVVLEE